MTGKREKKENFDFYEYQRGESERIKEWNEFVLGFRKQREESE